MIIKLGKLLALLFFTSLLFGQELNTLNKEEKIFDSELKEFSISCYNPYYKYNSKYKLDSVGNVCITSDGFNHYFKVNPGIYRGKISTEKFGALKNLLFEYKIFDLANNQVALDLRSIMNRTHSRIDIYYYIKLNNRELKFTSISIEDRTFYDKLNNLLISVDAINNLNLKIFDNDSKTLKNHKIIEYDSSWNFIDVGRNVDIVIGKTKLIKKFNENQYLYSIKVDSTCSYESNFFHPNQKIYVQSKTLINNLFKNKIGLIMIPTITTKVDSSLLSKTTYKVVKYHRVIKQFDPKNSYFFQFYGIYTTGDLIKSYYGTHDTKSEFNELEKEVLNRIR